MIQPNLLMSAKIMMAVWHQRAASCIRMLHHDEQLYPCQTGMYRECKFGTCKFFTLYLVLLEHESEITCSLKSYKYRSLDFRLISHQLECDHIAGSSRDA